MPLRRTILIGFALLVSSAASAHGQAILAPGGRTLFNQQLLVRSFMRIDRGTIVRDGVATTTRRYTQPVALVYGFAPGWHATAVTPFVLGNNRGRGDSRFFVKYDGLIKRNEPGGLTRLSAEVGVQAPTGSDGFSSGAAKYLADLVFLKASKQRHIVADVQYEAATRNGEGVSVGNRALFDVALSYLFLPERSKGGYHGMFGVVEFNGEIRGRASDRSGSFADSGGELLYFSPGLQWFVRRNLILEASAPIPVAHHLNGRQLEPGIGAVFGFRYVL